MYKLKNSYIDKMILAKLSSAEIDFLLYIARYQSDNGVVESVYYKDICTEIDISHQKFYDILSSLTEKGLISYSKANRADISVKLLDNDFSSQNFHDGYLKVASSDFGGVKFRRMKAGSKLLYLYMQRFTQGKHMLVRKFYDEFCNIFGVTAKSLQSYIRELKANFFLFISKKRNKAWHYEMTMKLSTVLHIKQTGQPTELDMYISNIQELVRRNFKRFLPEMSPDKTLHDIAMLAVTRKAKQYPDYIALITEAITRSIEKQKGEGRKQPILNAALVNSCLTDVLDERLLATYN